MRWIIGTTVWVALIGCGLLTMFNYEMTAGEMGTAPAVWPNSATIRQRTDLPTLLIFAHPKCPCTRATIAELARIMTHCSNRVEAHVVLLKPADQNEGWEKTWIWSEANAIPGVIVTTDRDGRLAELFSMATSGATLLYDTDGHCQFQGGITASRGHQGENAGTDAILALLNPKSKSPTPVSFECTAKTPVFGCPLCKRTQAKAGE